MHALLARRLRVTPNQCSHCRDELDGMIERRVRDFRLDSRLRRYCQDDIVALCGMLDSLGGDETDINICLQVCIPCFACDCLGGGDEWKEG